MNTGIQDAANLGWKLAATVQGWAPDGLLDTYDAERHPVGRQAVQQSGALLRIGLTGPPPLVGARNLLAVAASRIPFAARTLARGISGIGISYPAPRDAHPLTGKRAADLPLADSRRLYEALREGRFVLAAGAPLPPEALDGYGDRVTPVVTAAATSAITLVRPDAYIAWAADSGAGQGDAWRDATDQHAAGVREALARWCGQPERSPDEAARDVGHTLT
jgi:hypothetical protein